MQKILPTVAIVGRPNVGKSTLFNAFVGAKKAIVSDISGTTRDNVIERVSGDQINYLLIDTAGLTDGEGIDLEERIQTQAEIASQESDLVVFLIDAKAELTLDDREVADKLRKGKAPVIFCANKVDDGNESLVWNLLSLGLGEPQVVSAKNFIGVRDLADVIEKKLLELNPGWNSGPGLEDLESDEERVKIALIGRPNVGKSSLLNKLLGQDRSIVSNVPGTTRDTIDVKIEDKGNKFLLLDTAGLRRPGKFSGKNKNALKRLEFWSTVRTTRAIEQADVCAFLLDSLEGVTHQDLAILGKALDAEKGIIICVNKFDLAIEKARGMEETDERELDEVPMWHENVGDIRGKYITYLTRKMKFLSWASVVFMSAKTGKGVKDVYKEAKKISEERKKRISTAELNRFLPEMVHGHVLPSVGTKFGKIKFISQVDITPPKFIVHVNNVAAFHATYRRYVENKIRERYGFLGTPIIVSFRDAMDKFKGGKKVKKRTGKPRPGRHAKYATQRDPDRGASSCSSCCSTQQ